MSSQPSSKPHATSNRVLPVPTSGVSTQELSDRKQTGLWGGIKYSIPSPRRGKCADILQACREDIENISRRLRSYLERGAEDKEVHYGPQAQLTKPPFDVSRPPESSDALAPHTKFPEQPAAGERLTRHQALNRNSPPDHPDDQDNGSAIRDSVLTAARKTFKTVEAVSGTIPAVGAFVGVAAKLGLAFVNMIETMDKNENVTQELASLTSKLSGYLDHIKKKSDAEHGDGLTAHIHDLHRELESVHKKISGWNSLGHFKKGLLASDHAQELQGLQYTLLVSLKTSDLVVELKSTELRVERRRLLGCLGDGSYGARGNSVEDAVCLPGTRVEILDRINKWIKDSSTSTERVLWIRGMAGRGKSTIASTVAHHWASKGSCAIFHFRRGQNASDGQFICALARQLGKGLVPEMKNAILASVRENEDIAKERLDQQFKTLLVGSLCKLQDHPHPIVIIVDALDECENVADAVRFVRLIDRHSSLLPTNVKFLLTCRPEVPLLDALEPRKWHADDLDSISNVLEEDIAAFIQHSFAQIRQNRGLSEDWPPSADVKRMVEMSQGLFQWARTAITYVGDRSPIHRLQELLQHSSTWGKLDYLYRQILSKAFDEAAENPMRKRLLSWVLETLVVAHYPISLEVIAFLHADHEIFKGQGDTVQFLRNDILADLNSLLHIPQSPCEPLRLMHTSIRDLLLSRERCENQHYSVDLIQAHQRLAGVTLRIMERYLRQNICKLSDISKANSEVQDAVKSHVPQGLRYCCRSWSIHLTAGALCSEADGVTAGDLLSIFRMVCEQKLLAWLEVMSLIGATNEASSVAKQVHQWLEQWPPETSSGDLITLWNDTQRFIASFLEPISFSALHIYASALPHCPAETALWAKYGGQATTRTLCDKRQANWPANIWTASMDSYSSKIVFSHDGGALACVLTDGTVQLLDARIGASVGNRLTGHTERITSVVFSPEGEVLASVLGGNTVRLWDTRTGAQLGYPLTGHTGWIRCVVFSPDGTVLASGSKDNTIRLWDARTGAQLGDPFTGHTEWINSVVFSPDGNVLASGSKDNTVRLWDTRTGAQLSGPLLGHTEQVISVDFSPDGKVLASGSKDNTVRLWDTQTGAQLSGPLIGPTEQVISVGLSPDGKSLASGSKDNTVQLLWDTRTGAQLSGPLTGHTGSVSSVVFSPDGKVLASGSKDSTVRLWDTRTGAQLGDTLIGHTGSIKSVVFSPDSKVLASGSKDNTVRLWDVRTGAQLEDPLIGSKGPINSIVFSSDGKVLASGPGDKTVRLWDARTGVELCVPLTGHTEAIRSVVFSPDSKVLASASNDKMVRMWDARTGQQLYDPLTGHTGGINSVVFAPDGKILASVSDDNTVRLWDTGTGAQLGNPLIGHTKWIWSVAFSPDCKFLASGSTDKTVRLWDARTGAQLGDPLTGHTRWIRPVVFSPDSKILASGSKDNTIRLWDTRTGAQLGDPLTGHTGEIRSIVFSPDGKILASGSKDKMVRLWNVRTGAQLGDPLAGHPQRINSIVYSSDGKVLASRSADGTVRLWDPLTGQVYDKPLKIFDAGLLSIEANWIFWNSKRLLWLPVHHRSADLLSPSTILYSDGRLALLSNGKLSIIDVSELSTF